MSTIEDDDQLIGFESSLIDRQNTPGSHRE